ncbi:MAG: hypothetical protein P4L90_09895 [Rhodopila sp.]|nr:hypothetical protein [Rhodopila sp.]
MADEPGTTDRRIAFSHAFAVELPSAVVEATQQKNLTACLAAGCTVLILWSHGSRAPDVPPSAMMLMCHKHRTLMSHSALH